MSLSETERPWQPHERNYSGNRVGVLHQEGRWTILHIVSGIGETTTSIRDHEAWDLALRLSPALKARLEELFNDRRAAWAALHASKYPEVFADTLERVAEEHDCDSACCEYAGSDHGGLVCSRFERGEDCRAMDAEEMCEFAKAIRLASGMEARRAAAENTDAVHESPTGEAGTPNPFEGTTFETRAERAKRESKHRPNPIGDIPQDV